jgi:hypothetical protein
MKSWRACAQYIHTYIHTCIQTITKSVFYLEAGEVRSGQVGRAPHQLAELSRDGVENFFRSIPSCHGFRFLYQISVTVSACMYAERKDHLAADFMGARNIYVLYVCTVWISTWIGNVGRKLFQFSGSFRLCRLLEWVEFMYAWMYVCEGPRNILYDIKVDFLKHHWRSPSITYSVLRLGLGFGDRVV